MRRQLTLTVSKEQWRALAQNPAWSVLREEVRGSLAQDWMAASGGTVTEREACAAKLGALDAVLGVINARMTKHERGGV